MQMKELVAFIVIATMATGLIAQEGPTVMLLNYSTVQKKVEKSNQEIQDAKKAAKDKTWFNRGELFQDVFMLGLEQINEGMNPGTVKLFYGEPKSVENVTVDGEEHVIHVYDHIKYVYVNDALQEWERIDPIHPNPLEEAIKAYKKVLELDVNGKLDEKVKENLTELKNQLKRQGVNHYYHEQYGESLESFENVLDVNSMDLFAGEMDTLMVQYSGIISREIASKTDNKDLYRKAIDYYEQLAEVNYGGPNTYLQIKMDYMAIGDTMQALEVLKEAYEKFPDTINVIANIADTYIQKKMFDEGIEFMEGVIENNPTIAESYYWMGRLLINKEEVEYIDRAIEAYKKAAELDPSIYYVWYDMGYIYYLQGADFYERSNTEEHEPTRQRLMELGKEKYDEAIPVLERAFTLNEENQTVKYETLDLLQRIYYKEQMMDDYNRVKTLKESL